MIKPIDDAERTPGRLAARAALEAPAHPPWRPTLELLDEVDGVYRSEVGSPPAPDPVVVTPKNHGEVLITDTEAAEVYVPPTTLRKQTIPPLPVHSVRIRSDLDMRRQQTMPSLRMGARASMATGMVAGAAASEEAREDAGAGGGGEDGEDDRRSWGMVPALLGALAAAAMAVAVIRFTVVREESPVSARPAAVLRAMGAGPESAPDAVARPSVSTEPAAIVEPAAVAQPATNAQPAAVAQPAAIVEPATNAQPAAVAQPVDQPALSAEAERERGAAREPPPSAERSRSARQGRAPSEPAITRPKSPGTTTTGARQLAPFGVEKDG